MHDALALSSGPLVGFALGLVGGGFRTVPGLLMAADMPIIEAIGCSLVSAGVLGLTAAANYAVSGFIDWRVAAEHLAGGVLGGWAGAALAGRLAKERRPLDRAFAGVFAAVAVCMLCRSLPAIV